MPSSPISTILGSALPPCTALAMTALLQWRNQVKSLRSGGHKVLLNINGVSAKREHGTGRFACMPITKLQTAFYGSTINWSVLSAPLKTTVILPSLICRDLSIVFDYRTCG